MPAHRVSLILRFLPSLSDLAFIAPLAVQFGLAGGAYGLLADGDTGWHLRTGEWILENGRVPRVDIFSFTKAGQPWFAWEWLWDVSMAALHRLAGLPAVVLANAALISILFLLLYRITRGRSTNDYIAIAGTLLAVLYTSTYWLVRPHLVTLLFVLLFEYVLEKARRGRPKALWVLPPLTLLWANLHAGFVAGIFLVILYSGGALLAIAMGVGFRSALARSGSYLITAVGCLLASVVNPYGIEMHLHIWRYLADPFYAKYISEFQALSFQEPAARFFEVLVLFGACATVRSLRRGDLTHPLIFVVWLHLALTSARHSPVFVILVTPWICSELSAVVGRAHELRIHNRIKSALESFSAGAAEFSQTDRVERFYLLSLAALAFVAVSLFAPTPALKFRPDFDPNQFPVAAVNALDIRPETGFVFSTDRWGGYLIYRFFPSFKAFIDGRSDFYGPAFVKDYLDILNAQPGWEERLEHYQVSKILIPPSTPLSAVLKTPGHWRKVYDDKTAILFVRTGIEPPPIPARP